MLYDARSSKPPEGALSMAGPATLTSRQQEVKALLDKGMSAREVGERLGISRNAVYQQIQALRKKGVYSEGYTPSGEVRTPAPRASELVQKITATDGESPAPSPAATIAELLEDVQRSLRELRIIQERLEKYYN